MEINQVDEEKNITKRTVYQCGSIYYWNICAHAGLLYNLLSSEKFGYKIYENSPIIGSSLGMNNSFSRILTSIVRFFTTADIRQTLLFYFSGHGIPRQDDEVFLATPEVDPTEPMLGVYSKALKQKFLFGFF